MIARPSPRHTARQRRYRLLAALLGLLLIGLARPVAAQSPAQGPSPAAILLAKQIVELKGARELFTPLVRGVVEKVKDQFLQTNFIGTFELLEAAREYWSALRDGEREAFRFLHVSTDEVYGSLGEADPAFAETTAYAPNSPYAASKAGSDHLVRAWHHTYGLPTLVTNCSNNYGPYQFPEKLIPLMILNAVEGKRLPVYGDGQNVRDWLYVTDHCAAIRRVLAQGRPGQTYNIGGGCERRNLDVVRAICAALGEFRPKAGGYESQIEFVRDRPGHDRRYAIDAGKIEAELGWRPAETFESGLAQTVRWYLEHADWVAAVRDGRYRQWIELNYTRGEADPA